MHKYLLVLILFQPLAYADLDDTLYRIHRDQERAMEKRDQQINEMFARQRQYKEDADRHQQLELQRQLYNQQNELLQQQHLKH